MSFITRLTTAARTAAPSARITTNTITPSLAVSGQRLVSSTNPRDSGPVDATKETLKKADRKVSDAAVKGIETGGTFSSSLLLLSYSYLSQVGWG